MINLQKVIFLTSLPNNVYLNDKIINAKISTNSSGVIGNETTITLLSNGNKFAKIVSRYEFFEH